MSMSFLFRLSEKISAIGYVKAIRRAFLTMMPVIIIGSLSVLVNSFPVPAYQRFMEDFFGSGWKTFAGGLWQGSFAVLALGVVLMLSYYITSESEITKLGRNMPVLSAIVSFSSFLVLMQTAEGELVLTGFGAASLFIGILWATFSSLLFNRLMLLFSRRRSVTTDSDPAMQIALTSIWPSLIVVFFSGALRQLVLTATGGSIYTLFYNVMQAPFRSFEGSVLSSVIYVFVMHVLWMFGIHGSNVLEPVADNIYRAAQGINEAAVSAGAPPPEIFTKSFFDVFVFVGGSGATLALAIALLIMRRRLRGTTTRLAPMYILYSLFNINEALVYGLPIVLNPFYIIPFILTPIAFTLTSFAATLLGLVPHTISTVEWTTPILIGGYMATGSAAGSVLQVVNVALGVLIYMPFIKMAERQKQSDNEASFKTLMSEVDAKLGAFSVSIINRNDAVGALTRSLAFDMRIAITDPGKHGFYLVYQPIVSADGCVCGSEALLRWQHPTFGNVPPPIVVTIAEEAGIMRELGAKILDVAAAKLSEFRREGITDFLMMVNISTQQLDDPELFTIVKNCVEKHGVPPQSLELEITESGALNQSFAVSENIRKLREYGVCLSMDDFGMGHSSLLYVRRFPLSTIKIDGSLVKDIADDKNTRDIIASIVSLCATLEIHTVAEYVETDVQRDILKELGVDLFQGYFYAKPLPSDEILGYIKGCTAQVPGV